MHQQVCEGDQQLTNPNQHILKNFSHFFPSPVTRASGQGEESPERGEKEKEGQEEEQRTEGPQRHQKAQE